MSASKIVQFVCFETKLDSDVFINKWQDFARSDNIDHDVTMHQSVKANGFRYLAQHHCTSGDFKFVFEKSKRSSRTPEVEINAKLVGGYSLMQAAKKKEYQELESKVFAFLIDPRADLEVYKQLNVQTALNIYEAYYENCRFAYILEFFVDNANTEELMELLKQPEITESGIYKECAVQVI